MSRFKVVEDEFEQHLALKTPIDKDTINGVIDIELQQVQSRFLNQYLKGVKYGEKMGYCTKVVRNSAWQDEILVHKYSGGYDSPNDIVPVTKEEYEQLPDCLNYIGTRGVPW